MKSHSDRCPACHRRIKRSNQANARYWLLMHMASEKLRPGGKEYSAEQFHTYYKSKFLGCDDVSLPNGKTLTIPRSSADSDVSEFADYSAQVEADLACRDVHLED